MANVKKKRAVSVKPTIKPEVHIYFGRNTERLHVNMRLTAVDERALFDALRKRHPKW